MLRTTNKGFLGCRVNVGNEDAFKLEDFPPDQIELVVITNPQDWKVMAVVPAAAWPNDPSRHGAHFHFVFCARKKTQPLLAYAARMGFKDLTVYDMKRLFEFLHVVYEGKKPTGELQLLKALMCHALKEDVSDEVFITAMRRRHGLGEADDQEVPAEEHCPDAVVGDSDDIDSDDECLRQEVRDLREKAALKKSISLKRYRPC